MILRNLAVSNFIYITTTVWHFNSHPSMICPLLENVLTCFDMNRKFLRVGRQSSAESREFEKWNQAAAPGPGWRRWRPGPGPAFEMLWWTNVRIAEWIRTWHRLGSGSTSHKVYLICDNNNFRVSCTPKVCTTSSMSFVIILGREDTASRKCVIGWSLVFALYFHTLSLCNVMHSYQKFLKFASGIFERGREKWLVLASWGWAACNKFDAWYR